MTPDAGTKTHFGHIKIRGKMKKFTDDEKEGLESYFDITPDDDLEDLIYNMLYWLRDQIERGCCSNAN